MKENFKNKFAFLKYFLTFKNVQTWQALSHHREGHPSGHFVRVVGATHKIVPKN